MSERRIPPDDLPEDIQRIIYGGLAPDGSADDAMTELELMRLITIYHTGRDVWDVLRSYQVSIRAVEP